MMTKEKSPPFRKLKYLTVIPLVLLLAIIFNCTEKTTDSFGSETEVSGLEAANSDVPPSPPPLRTSVNGESEPALIFVEEAATFQGGGLEDFRLWIAENLIYPEEAIEKGILGRVIAQFVVDSKGKVGNVVILRGVDPSLDNETKRVILSSPAWEPAKQAGEAVQQIFTIHVVFTLSDNE